MKLINKYIAPLGIDIEYKVGKKDGTWTSWWDYDKTRKEMQGSYKKGKMVDKWYFYNNKGNLKEIRYFSPVF